VIKVTLVLALGLAGTMMLRRRSAALRHWMLAGAIACAALMPLAEVVAPAWQLPLLPMPGSRLAPALTLGDAPGREAASAAGVAQVIGSSSARVFPTLRTVWLLGAGLSLLMLGAGIARLLVVASRARPIADGRWAAAAIAFAERCNLKRVPEILQTGHPTLLFTWGLRQPKVLVPRDAGNWSDERIRIVLGHELAHVRRGDWAVQLAADCVRSAYWFNPLAWIACWRLRLESEHSCDDAVLGLGVAPPDYATQLLDLARLFRHSRRSFFPAPAMARPSDLERRVRAMLNTRTDRSPVGRVSGWLVALGLVALTVPIAGLSLSAAGQPAAAGERPAVSASPAVGAPHASEQARPSAPATVVPPAAAPVPASTALRAAERPRVAEAKPQAGAQAAFAITVADQLGRTVPQAAVSLSNEAAGLHPELRTDQNGEGTASGLPAGDYQLSVWKPGFKTVKTSVALTSGQTTRSRVTLQLGMLAETVVINAQPGVTPAAVGSAQPGVPAPTSTIAPQARRVGTAPSEDPCSQSAEGGCVTPPRKLVDAKPIYPAWAVEGGASGTVVIKGRLRTDGSVGDMQPAPDTNPDFANAAMRAITLWQFSPARLDGVPMDVDIEVTVVFALLKK
jgi:TonB family protein